MSACRFWMYGKGSWSGPLVYRGGDEYGNSTLVFRLPGERAFIVAYNWPLRRELEPSEGHISYGLVSPDESDGATWDNPLPLASEQRFDPVRPGWKVATRTAWMTPWEEFVSEKGE